ncbi:hypothetical protein [Streptomyces globisporus]|uniref:hypothetical protein n=1 Tax=Streptomyces globisporus TaxID=1908 RepID=UPI00099B43EF|nr:hypothetical protein [Streptomyces globisporus]
MSKPQQGEQRRSGRGAATPEDVAALKARQKQEGAEKSSGPAHGTDKGDRGGGEGGGTPPDQKGMGT